MTKINFTRGLMILALLALLGLQARPAAAVPTQYGDSGLLSQPTADTLNAGNICLGLWANCSSGPDSSSATIVPVAMTLGLGSFLEAYGSYPNLLFNDEDLASGRGYVNLGMKIRVFGPRSSPIKLAVDGQMRRTISDLKEYDGLTDYLARGIASVKLGNFGVHANGGYLFKQAPAGLKYEDQVVYGGGVEFYPMTRLRLLAEVEGATELVKGTSAPLEVTGGLQYYFSPHLTLNLGVGVGLSDVSPDWRGLFGLTVCQGIGTYSRPIPKLVSNEPAAPAEPVEPVKVSKIKTLTPLVQRSAAPVEAGIKYEVPVEPGKEEVVLNPADAFVLPEGAMGQEALPVSPVGSITPTSQPGKPLPLTTGDSLTTIVYRKFRLSEQTFDPSQWTLSEEGKRALAEVAETLRKDSRWISIRIDGYTDNVGSESYNQKTSLERAIFYANYLVTNSGIGPGRVFVKGLGESAPIATNETPEGRAENRRVEILVLIPKPGTP